MPELITEPSRVAAAGQPPKLIDEYIGRANTGQDSVSIAHMRSPSGWAEPGQRPEFDEFTIVLRGSLVVESEGGQMTVQAGQAIHARPGEWVRYSTPGAGGAEYISVCLPAFAPDTVHRDDLPSHNPVAGTPRCGRCPVGGMNAFLFGTVMKITEPASARHPATHPWLNWSLSRRGDRGCARGRAGVDGLGWRVRPHGAGRPAFNSQAGRCCRSTPGACAA
jgi:mannose-6-phosphate isomerase-like protein (cupin superfamily)